MGFRVASLFAGCGGKDLGFLEAGFDIVWANDIDRAATETYRRNVGNHVTCGDIRAIPSAHIPDVDVVIGGFPCQGFSIVGTRRLDDDRNFLYHEMKRVISDKRPLFFVAENVRGLLNMNGGRVVTAMMEEFRSLGYNVSLQLLNARDFGVPQHRERVFIIGNRIGVSNPFPRPTHGNTRPSEIQLSLVNELPLAPFRTLADAIGDLGALGTAQNHDIDTTWQRRHPEYLAIMEHIKPGQKLCNVRLGPRSVYTWDIPEVFGPVTPAERCVLLAVAGNRRRKEYGPKDGNALALNTIETLVELPRLSAIVKSLVRKKYLVEKDGGYELKNAFNGIFRRLRWNEPSEAILTVFSSPRYYVHPTENRPFSVRECARIQEFPDSFTFCGALEEQHTQIGNAVPVGLARAVASELLATLHRARVAPVSLNANRPHARSVA